MSIEIKGIQKKFGAFTALDGIDLNIPTGELVSLLGPSGCGKTTLLRIIAGLEDPDRGDIKFHGEDATQTTARDRGVGFVFQHYALFRHMTVGDNIGFGLSVRPRKDRPSKSAIREKVMELLKLVQLESLYDRYPAQLSGGQRQRIALARALAVEPKVLLLDEPFGALDAGVRKELRRWLRRLHDEIHVTSVFVTHDQEEALEVADRIVLMNKGRIEQIGTPEEVYEKPATPFVYRFLGNMNVFHSRIDDGRTKLGGEQAEAPAYCADVSGAFAYVRSYDIAVSRKNDGDGAIEAVVTGIHPLGASARIEVKRLDNGQVVEAEVSREKYKELQLVNGESVFIKPNNVTFYEQDYQI
ncbi:MAG TPA: sulfate ABC transporter ATP-binding protein [Nitrospirota bacterium]|jgi:sulfate transport system ATP-binding protein